MVLSRGTRMRSLDEHGNANAQSSFTYSAHKRPAMYKTHKRMSEELFATSLETRLVLEINCIHRVNAILWEMPFMQTHANAVLQRLLTAAVTLHGAATRQDPHLDISFLFCFVSFGFRIFVIIHTIMQFIRPLLPLKHALPSVYTKRRMFHATVSHRFEEQETRRPKEYELRVGFGKENMQCT